MRVNACVFSTGALMEAAAASSDEPFAGAGVVTLALVLWALFG